MAFIQLVQLPYQCSHCPIIEERLGNGQCTMHLGEQVRQSNAEVGEDITQLPADLQGLIFFVLETRTYPVMFIFMDGVQK